MFKNIEEFKEFINWCKQNKVKSFKIGEFSAEISDIALIDELNQSDTEPSTELLEKAQEIAEDHKLEAKLQAEEDESLLFWSAD